jgi:hypothetical protein
MIPGPQETSQKLTGEVPLFKERVHSSGDDDHSSQSNGIVQNMAVTAQRLTAWFRRQQIKIREDKK